MHLPAPARPDTILPVRLWFLTHDDRTGAPLVDGPVLNAALGAAVIADLMIRGYATVDAHRQLSVHVQDAPATVVATVIHAVTATNGHRTLRDCVRGFADLPLAGQTREFMTRRMLVYDNGRRFGIGPRRYVPTNGTDGAAPRVELLYYARNANRPDVHLDLDTGVLAALAAALGEGFIRTMSAAAGGTSHGLLDGLLAIAGQLAPALQDVAHALDDVRVGLAEGPTRR